MPAGVRDQDHEALGLGQVQRPGQVRGARPTRRCSSAPALRAQRAGRNRRRVAVLEHQTRHPGRLRRCARSMPRFPTSVTRSSATRKRGEGAARSASNVLFRDRDPREPGRPRPAFHAAARIPCSASSASSSRRAGAAVAFGQDHLVDLRDDPRAAPRSLVGRPRSRQTSSGRAAHRPNSTRRRASLAVAAPSPRIPAPTPAELLLRAAARRLAPPSGSPRARGLDARPVGARARGPLPGRPRGAARGGALARAVPRRARARRRADRGLRVRARARASPAGASRRAASPRRAPVELAGLPRGLRATSPRTRRGAVVGGCPSAVAALAERLAGAPASAALIPPSPPRLAGPGESSYLHAVERVKKYIRAGDVYQVNLARRLDAPAPSAAELRALYARLRRATARALLRLPRDAARARSCRLAGALPARRGAARRDLPHQGHAAARRDPGAGRAARARSSTARRRTAPST